VFFSDAFDFEYGVGILRTPDRLYTEDVDQDEDDDAGNHVDEENNYDGGWRGAITLLAAANLLTE